MRGSKPRKTELVLVASSRKPPLRAMRRCQFRVFWAAKKYTAVSGGQAKGVAISQLVLTKINSRINFSEYEHGSRK
jgi:hypothetical protein